ncbi:MAG: CapA family protein [Anaerolineae bacterium]|nr:CapA family protein [Candidatus Roseilinea sp.]MDW8449313.1 CapA family protein [Anaerolineae bacterium]
MAARTLKRVACCVCAALVLAGCGGAPQPEPTPEITVIFHATPTPTPEPTPTPVPVKTIWIDPALPTRWRESLVQQMGEFAQRTASSRRRVTLTDSSAADVRIGVGDAGAPLITHTLAVAAPFPTVPDGIAFADFARFWRGEPAALAGLSDDEQTPPTLFLDPETRAVLTLLLGPAAESQNIQIVPVEEVITSAWAAQPAAFAVVPFDRLEARWKLLHVDGINLFEREADMSAYPLTLSVRAQGDPALVAEIATTVPAANNRDLSKMAIVAMTGVTALVRGTAVRMEEKGITYPAEKIRDWLVTADVTHISNEVSFWENCPPPSFSSGVVMCSDPRYMELLRYVGTDVIELTGNHLWDYGYQRVIPTIEMYEREGWHYFGGGRDLADALKPLTMTVNGNRIAFIGCNHFGANWATERLPGSAPCSPNDPKDLSYQIETIRQLKAEGYNVIATLQYEEYYFYQSTPQQRRDFAALRDAGAVVVNGSQGHHVQGFDVNADGFIHWGTGNIFFGDQTFSRGALTTMVDRHVFYDNRYLGVDLRTAFIEDLSQPRPMTPEERAELLRKLFEVSRFQ